MADLTITAASVLASASASTLEGTAGATVTAGQPVYLDAADGKLKLTDASSSAEETACVGIALNNASTGQPVEYVNEDDGFTPGATLVAGEVYAVSAAAGGAIAPVADLVATNYTQVLGVAISTSVMKLCVRAGLRSDVAHG